MFLVDINTAMKCVQSVHGMVVLPKSKTKLTGMLNELNKSCENLHMKIIKMKINCIHYVEKDEYQYWEKADGNI